MSLVLGGAADSLEPAVLGAVEGRTADVGLAVLMDDLALLPGLLVATLFGRAGPTEADSGLPLMIDSRALEVDV